MKTMKKLWVLSLLLFTGMVQAHVGHEHMSLMDGLLHPFGFDHLLAMMAVGLWSARSFKRIERFYAPVLFVTTLLLGAISAHFTGIEFSASELLIAGSVLAFGVLLGFKQIPNVWGFVLIAVAGWVHGWAHGAEATEGGVFALYVVGFVLSTAALHGLGVAAGSRLLQAQLWLWRVLGLMMGVFGIYALATL